MIYCFVSRFKYGKDLSAIPIDSDWQCVMSKLLYIVCIVCECAFGRA